MAAPTTAPTDPWPPSGDADCAVGADFAAVLFICVIPAPVPEELPASKLEVDMRGVELAKEEGEMKSTKVARESEGTRVSVFIREVEENEGEKAHEGGVEFSVAGGEEVVFGRYVVAT